VHEAVRQLCRSNGQSGFLPKNLICVQDQTVEVATNTLGQLMTWSAGEGVRYSVVVLCHSAGFSSFFFSETYSRGSFPLLCA
jgi:hypothetical protein